MKWRPGTCRKCGQAVLGYSEICPACLGWVIARSGGGNGNGHQGPNKADVAEAVGAVHDEVHTGGFGTGEPDEWTPVNRNAEPGYVREMMDADGLVGEPVPADAGGECETSTLEKSTSLPPSPVEARAV